LELAQFFWFLFEFAQSFVVGACPKICCFYLNLHKALLLELAQKFVVFCFSLHKALLLKLEQKFVLFKLKTNNLQCTSRMQPFTKY
jgi:hypothetical protein